VGLAEGDDHDELRSATIGAAIATGNAVEARRILDELETFFGEHPSVIAVDALIEVLSIP